MLIRMVEVVEVREVNEALNEGLHLKVRLRNDAHNGRGVWIEIDQPTNHVVHFEPQEEMVMVLIPAQSLLAHVAKALADHDET